MVEDTKRAEAKMRLAKHYAKMGKAALEDLEARALNGDVDPDSPGILANGLPSRYGVTAQKLDYAKRKRGDEFWDFYILWTKIQETLEQLDHIMAQIRERMDELLDHIEAINDNLLELDHNHDAIEKELDYFQKNGVFDLDENGNFKDPRVRAVVEEYESHTGRNLDLDDHISYSVLMDIWMELDVERRQLQQDLQTRSDEYDYWQDQLEKAQQIKDDLESGDYDRSMAGLSASDEFFSNYEAGYSPLIQSPEIESKLSVFEDLPGQPIEDSKMDDDNIFGFPPIGDDFQQAVSPAPKKQLTPEHQKPSTLPAKPNLPVP